MGGWQDAVQQDPDNSSRIAVREAKLQTELRALQVENQRLMLQVEQSARAPAVLSRDESLATEIHTYEEAQTRRRIRG